MKISKKIRFIALIGGVVFALTAFANATNNATENSFTAITRHNAKKNAASTNYDFSSEETITSDKLSCTVSSSTTTEVSHAFRVSFSSLINSYSNGTRFNDVYVTINDSSFSGNVSDYPSVDNEEDRPVFEASVYRISTLYNTNNNNGFAVIPQYINYSKSFRMHVTSMSGNVVPADVITDAEGKVERDNAHYLTAIYIPADITVASSEALMNLPNDIEIKMQASSIPEGFASDWTNSKNVTFNADYDSLASNRKTTSTSPKSWGTGEDFMIGYKGEGDKYKPLVVEYQKTKTDGSVVTEYMECQLESTQNIYDGVGSGAGSSSLSKNIDISKEIGETIDPNSLVFHNVYPLVREGTGLTIDPSGTSYKVEPVAGFSATYDLSEFIKVSSSRASYFSGYTQFDVSVDRVPGTYEKVNKKIYDSFKNSIAAGDYRIRYQFYALSQAYYRVKYLSNGAEKEARFKVSTPTNLDFALLEKDSNNEVGFIFNNSEYGEDFSYSNIQSIALEGFSVKLDIYSDENNAIATKSNTSTRFGKIYLYEKNATTYVDLDLTYILACIIYTVAFAALAVGYYFYSKNKYKNDEFRRMNTKKYIVTSLKNYVGFALVMLAILSIVARWGIMNTSIIAYNPIDVFVIIFVIAGGIFLGFFIKNMVVSIKNAMKRKEAEKLKLDQDKAEDGTN